jgi:hypothetical protein
MDESGEIVEPQAPQFLSPIATNGERLTRLDLANWLVSKENPLTARVFVNRLWDLYLGQGLSKNLDDLGSQGETPIHQELLDWLAVEFMESGWDVKHIIRTMMLSETYRRSSEPTAELRERDPYNRLHGRQPMMRLDAEFIRDNALTVSGLLNRKMGGPSAKPYQPQGYYAELNFPKRVYKPDLNADQFRRGVYTHWQRTFVHPSMMAFDAPSREECTADRTVSNTPLQSLALLNDTTYVEAARALAERMMAAAGEPAECVQAAFRAATARLPEPDEVEVLVDVYRRQLAAYREHPERAEALLSVGASPRDASLDVAEHAAWTTVASMILNLDETVTKD